MRILFRFNALISRMETAAGASLGLLVAVLILINVVTRALNNAFYWTDEAAITAMVWMAFLGSSFALGNRHLVAVTLLPDALPAQVRRYIAVATDLAVLAFALALLVLNWNWFDPLALARHGFDTKAFAGATFNFIYSETTNTLGIPKFWLWLVLPVFSFNITVNALANLLERTQSGQERDVR